MKMYKKIKSQHFSEKVKKILKSVDKYLKDAIIINVVIKTF